MYQELLLKEIRSKIGEKSLNDEIANVLNISYDAAHRRTSMKSKFSLEESLLLAKFYHISLDKFLKSDDNLMVQKTKAVSKTEDLYSFFENTLDILSSFQFSENSVIYYSAKDIPFFYTLSDTPLSRFKIYVWMNLLNSKQVFIPFRDFKPEPFSSKTKVLREIYEQQNVIELWNDMTIASILLQISFYSEIGLLWKEDAVLILEELENLIHYIENKTENESRFQIYQNELVHLSNDIFINNGEQSTLVIPCNMFGYLLLNDSKTCKETLNYFEHQIKNCKSLNTAGNRDRKLFFNRMYQQIENLKEKLQLL
ncbi:MAG: XRE family transcriptional regulator [Chryseobacterium sp.]|nr:XRE family transcriptional regulator [Chryseobacterium sp.]MBP7499160.1 XRE family transcriptional regulator [Chryseobacterium sp.]